MPQKKSGGRVSRSKDQFPSGSEEYGSTSTTLSPDKTECVRGSSVFDSSMGAHKGSSWSIAANVGTSGSAAGTATSASTSTRKSMWELPAVHFVPPDPRLCTFKQEKPSLRDYQEDLSSTTFCFIDQLKGTDVRSKAATFHKATLLAMFNPLQEGKVWESVQVKDDLNKGRFTMLKEILSEYRVYWQSIGGNPTKLPRLIQGLDLYLAGAVLKDDKRIKALSGMLNPEASGKGKEGRGGGPST